MGIIIFEGPKPFALRLRKPPTALAEGESVVATLPISSPDTDSEEIEIRLHLTIHQAEHLEAVVHAALVSARQNLRHGRA